MKTSRFSDSQIISILKQAEAGSPVPELCREHGISSATFYKWRAKFGGMDASLMLPNISSSTRRVLSRIRVSGMYRVTPVCAYSYSAHHVAQAYPVKGAHFI